MHPTSNIVGEMLQAGAVGYITKNCASTEMGKAIRVAMSGTVHLSPDISRKMVEDYVSKKEDSTSKATGLLSDRENEVLQLVAEGKPSKMIASELYISEKTVGVHRQNIMDKLGVRSVAELTKYAIRQGLTAIE